MTPARRTTAVATTAVVLATAGTLLTTAPAANAAVTCASPVFKRQFYANTGFSGTPKKTDCDSAINENWGAGAPASGLPSNNFGVRWTVTRDFGSGGPFTFTAAAQDGIRVYVDGTRKIDLWKNVSSTQTKTLNLTIPSGKHTLRVDYVNWTGSANVKFTYAPRTSATVDKVKPLAPKGISVAYDKATNKARLTWAKNAEMDLAGYRVYRRLSTASTWTKVGTATATSTTAYTDSPPATGKSYVYEVRAYDKAGNTSTGSADLSVTAITLATPTGLTATGADAGIAVSWQPVAGAVKYRLAHDDSGAYTTVTGTSYTDSSVARSVYRSYKVAAVDASGHVSAYSAVTAQVRRPVAAPYGMVASAASGTGVYRLYVNWTVNTATGGAYDTFHVYRSTSLPVDTTAEPFVCDDLSYNIGDDERGYSCRDEQVAPATTYHYVVKGVDDTGTESLPSATVSVATPTPDTTAPAPVTGLTATPTKYGIELDWADNAESDVVRYVVYRGVPAGDGDGQSCGSLGQIGTAFKSQYTHLTLPDGGRNCYLVDAVDDAGNSAYTATGQATTVHVTELDVRPSVASPTEPPVTVNGFYDTSFGRVELSWNVRYPYDTNKYYVYRWNPATQAYEKLTTTPLTTKRYFDTTAEPGTTHFYWVTVAYTNGESEPGSTYVIRQP
ncbi:fibronectin type III domain-containing protein [Streptomyces ipomoeae]|uniref:fibronectin type III domain-containing protein n=1 Tax=Streptomyces ipomoeae TaxID=103232 RepID=UPI0011476D57|nr:PA14 domain-containing protein [Streptomyces ipomoeae]MDX2936808.1 PA14 domain-containing protein [Streptomyces ipomoeae]TQE23835.1 hypothetical protein SipoB123_20105 [Streptomyces ipomoeae]